MLKSLILLPFFALAAAAQQDPSVVPPLSFPTPKIFIPSPPKLTLPQSCPVGMAARPGGAPQSLAVNAVEDAIYLSKNAARTGVHVRLASFGGAAMTHLTVAVSYRVYPDGITLVSTRPRLSQKQTFELTARDATVLERNLIVPGHVQIDRIRVLKVDYSDGTHWQATGDTTCSIRPSSLVLVGAR